MGRFDDRMTGQDSTRVPVITCGYMLVPLSEIRATGRVPGLGRDRVRHLLSMGGQPTEDLKHAGLKRYLHSSMRVCLGIIKICMWQLNHARE